MHVITMLRPWSWAVSNGRKPVLNRSRRPPAAAIGGDVAIHACQQYDYEARVWMWRGMGLAMPPGPTRRPGRRVAELVEEWCIDAESGKAECPTGIVAVARLSGWFQVLGDGCTVDIPGCNGLTVDEAAVMARSPWIVGPVCWVLDDVRPLTEPAPHRGRQGVYALGTADETKVLERLQ